MSWLSVFFRKDSVQAVLQAGLKILKAFIGKVGEDLQKIAQEEVATAETLYAAGKIPDKRAYVQERLKARFPQIREVFINHAIETAVIALMAAKQ